MKIRTGKMTDFDELWKILSETKELQINDDGETYDKEWLKAVFSKKNNIVLIAEDKNKFIGFLIAHHLPSVFQTIINDIFVVPEYRKKGIAASLIKQSEQISKKKNFKYVTALVQEGNNNMIRFITNKGYKKGNKFYFFEKKI